MIDIEKSLAPDRVLRRWDGHERQASRMKARELLASDMAEAMVSEAVETQATLRTIKERWFADVDAFIQLILEEYGVRLSGARGGNTFENHDLTRKVQISVADQKTVNQAIIPAQALVNEILDDLTGQSDPNLRLIVNAAFSRHPASGRISIERILGLKNLKLNHPRWPSAEQALSDAVETIGSRMYLRFYHRETSQKPWQQVELNFSRL